MEMAAAATRPSGPVLSIPNYGSASPNRVKLALVGAVRSPAKSVRVSVSSPRTSSPAAKSRRSCMCSPTNHAGSFRCSLHKDRKPPAPGGGHGHSKPAVLSAADAARILAKRAIAPSQPSQNRRRVAAAGPVRPRPSRLAAVSFAGDNRQ